MARSRRPRVRSMAWLIAMTALAFAAQALAQEWWERPWDYKVPLRPGQRPRPGTLLDCVNDLGGDGEKDNQRDISKSRGRIRKFRIQTVYRLNELRHLDEVLALGAGPMAEAAEKAAPHFDKAETLVNEAVELQKASNFADARAKIDAATAELSAGETVAETAIAVRAEQLHIQHLRNAAALAGMAELNAEIDAMAKTAAAEAEARVKDLRAATAAQQQFINQLRVKLTGLRGDIGVKRECADMLNLYEYLLRCAVKDGPKNEIYDGEKYARDAELSDLTLGADGSVARRVLQLRGRLRQVSYRMSALSGTPVTDSAGDKIAAKTGYPIDDLDTFTRSKFGIVRSWRMNDNHPWDWEFNYTPVGADAVSIAGRWDFQVDPRFEGEDKGWQQADFKPAGWKNLYAPNAWERQGVNEWNSIDNFKACYQKVTGREFTARPNRGYEHTPEHRHYNGVAWYRKAVFVPENWAGADVILHGGGMGGEFRVYCNGQLAESQWKGNDIRIPAAAVKFGQLNQLAVQCFNGTGFGGFTEGNLWLVRDGGKADWRLTAIGGGWVNEETFGLGQGGQTARYATVIGSATPAALIATDARQVNLWGWSMKGYTAPTEALYAGDGGVTTVKLDADKPVAAGAAMKENWVLLNVPAVEGGYGNPVLVVFQHRPKAVRWSAKTGAEGLVAEFDGPAGAVALVHPAKAGADAATLTAKARQWSQAALAYPEHASELWTVDATKTNLPFEVMGTFNLIYNYHTIQDDWNTTPLQVAGLPALACYALDYKYPGCTEGDWQKTGAPIKYQAYAEGEFRAKSGTDRLTYVTPCADHATMWKGVGTLFQEVWGPAVQTTHKWGSNNNRAGFAFHQPWHVQLMESFGLNVRPQSDPKWREVDRTVNLHKQVGLFLFILDFSNDQDKNPASDYYPHTGGYLREVPQALDGLAEFWKALAIRYKDASAAELGFNFNNEPCTIDCEMYNKLVRRLTESVRSVSKDKWITLDFGDGWAQPDFVFGTEPTGDALTAYNYHLYYKHDNIIEGRTPELLFPQYNEEDPFYWCNSEDLFVNRIQDTFIYQTVHHVPVWCGEFGGAVNNPNQEGILWCEEHCTMMERMGHGWSWWNWDGAAYGRTGLQARDQVSPMVLVLKRFMHRKGAY